MSPVVALTMARYAPRYAELLRDTIRARCIVTGPEYLRLDADVVVRLVEVGLEDGDRARDLLTDLRAAGYDVVKRAEP